MLGQQILGMRAKKWGESTQTPSRLCIDPLKKTLKTLLDIFSTSCDQPTNQLTNQRTRKHWSPIFNRATKKNQ